MVGPAPPSPSMLRSRFPVRSLSNSVAPPSSRSLVESVPPSSTQRSWPSRLGEWLMTSGWRIESDGRLPFGRRLGDAIAAARLDFADALSDVRTDGAADALDRIAETSRLDELWHLRAEVFGRVAERHGQAEAERRLAAIDAHFARKSRRRPYRARARR
jgi:hypothetical protein